MSRVRFEASTDGVIAILITILVLEIHLPDTRHTWATVWHMAPVFAAGKLGNQNGAHVLCHQLGDALCRHHCTTAAVCGLGH